MARILSGLLEVAMNSVRRQPDWRLEIYDLRSTRTDPTPVRINDVVGALQSGATLAAIVGPRDFTDDVVEIRITEVAGDYANQGIAASSLEFIVVDPTGELDPVDNPPTVGDPEALGRWMRQGNVVVLREGDAAEPDVTEWPITFVGKIQGQPSQDRNRTTRTSFLQAKANSREVDFLRDTNTTRDYLQDTPLQDIAEEIASTDMGLAIEELNLPTFTSRLTGFRSTQFVQESPLVSIAKIMFLDGFMPRFGGDGRLTATSGSITKSAARIFEEFESLVTIKRPILDFNGVNEVVILGLDSRLTTVVQGVQEIARAGITTGFFSRDSEIPVRWSEDKTQQAFNVFMQVLSSIGDAPFAFGSESFANFPLSDGGSVEGIISVDGALFSGVAVVALILVSLILSLVVFDIAIGGPGASEVIPTGRAVTVAAVQAIQLILGQQGRGEYRIYGEPYELVFKELRAVARVAGILSQDRQTLEIENHLVNSQAECDEIASRILQRERVRQNLRTITMIHDLKLEPDDVLELGIGTAARRYMIDSVSRTLKRGESTIATLNCYEVTAGVRP